MSKVANSCPTLGQLLDSRILDFVCTRGKRQAPRNRQGNILNTELLKVGQLLINSSPIPHPMGSCRGLPCNSPLATPECFSLGGGSENACGEGCCGMFSPVPWFFTPLPLSHQHARRDTFGTISVQKGRGCSTPTLPDELQGPSGPEIPRKSETSLWGQDFSRLC